LFALCAVQLMMGSLLHDNVSAQSMPALDIERFVPALSPQGFLSVQGTRTPGPGHYTLLAAVGFEANPLSLPATSPYNLHKIDTRIGAWLGAELGLGGRLAVGALLPTFPYQNATFSKHTPSFDDSLGFALGDVRLHARYRLLGESSSREDAPTDGPGLALEARGALPTHTDDAVAGEKRVSAELHMLADFQLLGAGIAGDVGFHHRFGETQVANFDGTGSTARPDPIHFHDELLFGAAIKVPLPPAPSIVTILEVRGATDFRSSEATSVELDLGAQLGLDAWKLTLGGGLGLTSGFGSPDGRLLLGVSYSPRASDGDSDGVDDDKDQCAFLPEDKDGYQDQDGCPDPDNDNDLIPDLDDLCPSDAAEEGRDDDEDGCTDGTKPTKGR
jgi:hypothetical protein